MSARLTHEQRVDWFRDRLAKLAPTDGLSVKQAAWIVLELKVEHATDAEAGRWFRAALDVVAELEQSRGGETS